MGNSKTLGKYLTAKHHQRLSIAEVHRLWNAELHHSVERTPYTLNSVSPSILNESGKPDLAKFSAFTKDLQKVGKWQDASGNTYSNDHIDEDIVELIQKGELQAYPGKDPSINPIPVDELQGVNLRPLTSRYHIDRDELGCFLFSQGHSLPAFWYKPTDDALYKDRIANQRQSVKEMREHLKAVIAENGKLRQELLNARPFMDPQHPFFAPELEAANAIWLKLFSNKSEGDLVAAKPKMELWLEEHRPDVLNAHGTGKGKNAKARIVTIANPRKEPGRRPKPTTS